MRILKESSPAISLPSGNQKGRKRSAKESPSETNEVQTSLCTNKSALFCLSWEVEWMGSYSIGKVTAECISRRLDSVLNIHDKSHAQSPSSPQFHSKAVILSVSLIGVSVTLLPQQNCGTEIANLASPIWCQVLNHHLQKVCCVVGRVISNQIAYITREKTCHNGDNIPYKKQIHVFRTKSPFEVEEIENVLNNAFQKAAVPQSVLNSSANQSLFQSRNDLHSSFNRIPLPKKPPFLTSKLVGSDKYKDYSGTPKGVQKSIKQCKNIKTPDRRIRPQMISTSSVLQRIFGGFSDLRKQQSQICMDKGANPGNSPKTPTGKLYASNVRLRSSRFSFTPVNALESREIVDGESSPKKRRPVSIFSQNIFQRFSSSIITNSTKRNELPSPPLLKQQLQSEQSIGTQKTPSLSSSIAATVGQNGSEICMQKKSTDLVYDEKLTEWIYPIDETLEELDKLAYFCRDTNKDLVVKQLRGKSDGVFVIRPSGSRNRCLALSLCVPEEINKRRIANYLIVRNEHGYRIKGSKRYFQSLPQLITHHTVVEEQLPCRLRYSDWREIDIGTYENDVSKQVNTEDTTTICLTDSESANSMAIRWRKLPDHQQSNSRITRVDREKFPDLLLGK